MLVTDTVPDCVGVDVGVAVGENVGALVPNGDGRAVDVPVIDIVLLPETVGVAVPVELDVGVNV